MRITTRGRYALRALLAMAKMGKDGGLISINSLSEAEQISSVFLEQIFFKLKKAGIVSSVRGPGGGFAFARALDQVSVKDILYAAGEELDSGTCDKHEQCTRISSCASHKVWIAVSDLVINYLDGLTLAALLKSAEAQDDDKRPVKHEVS